MAEKVRLVYEDFRPLKRGEPGYSPTKRLLISPSTGEIITRRQFINKAQKTTVPQKSTPTKEKKPRKPRVDKGIAKADRALIREQRKEHEKRRKIKLNKENAQKRFESAKRSHIHRLNKEREKRGLRPLDENYEPNEPLFYEQYDRIKHPDKYGHSEVQEARDYFWNDEYNDEEIYDFPDGETP